MILKIFSAVLTHVMNINAKFHLNQWYIQISRPTDISSHAEQGVNEQRTNGLTDEPKKILYIITVAGELQV